MKKRIVSLIMITIIFLGFSYGIQYNVDHWNDPNSVRQKLIDGACDTTDITEFYTNDYFVIFAKHTNIKTSNIYLRYSDVIGTIGNGTDGNPLCLFNPSQYTDGTYRFLNFNADFLDSRGRAIYPGETVRHLTTAQEYGNGWQYGEWILNSSVTDTDLPGTINFNRANIRNPGNFPNSLKTGTDYDCQVKIGTVYDSDDDPTTVGNNEMVISCRDFQIRWCGDGILATTKGEQCDDNNRVNGDGCSSTCHLETPTVILNANPKTGSEPLDVQFTVTIPSWASVVSLNYADGSSVVNSPSFPNNHTYQNKGSYVASVTVRNNISESIMNGNLPRPTASDTEIINPVDGCMDGELRPDKGEQCDDGNNKDNDGCSSCELEVPVLALNKDYFTGNTPFLLNFDINKEFWMDLVSLNFGDGTIVYNDSPTYTHLYPLKGSYFLEVTLENGYTGAIAPNIERPTASTGITLVLSNWCGDGILDEDLNEQCDDHNNNNGDACSSSCKLETPSITMTGNPSLGAEPLNTTILINKNSWERLLTMDFGDGTAIKNNPTINENHTYQNTGTYIVELVTQNGYTGTIASGLSLPQKIFTGTISVINGCGNGVLLTSKGEQCDDGNLANGDGCDLSCNLELPTGNFTVNPASGSWPLNVTFDVNSIPSWVKLTKIDYDDTTSDTINPTFSLNHTYSSKGVYVVNLTMQNNYAGVIDNNISRPVSIRQVTITVNNYCGDGILDEDLSEQCDDHNNDNGDGCNSTCTLESPTGNFTVSPASGSWPLNVIFNVNSIPSWVKLTKIDYDDTTADIINPTFPLNHTYSTKNIFTANLTMQNNYAGAISTTVIRPSEIKSVVITTTNSCGDGSLDIDLGEQCDDTNKTAGDGCSSACQLEMPTVVFTPSLFTGSSPLDVNFNTVKPNWVKLVSLDFGDGSTPKLNPTINEDHQFINNDSSDKELTVKLEIQNNLSGPGVDPDIIKPTTIIELKIIVTPPLSEIPVPTPATNEFIDGSCNYDDGTAVQIGEYLPIWRKFKTDIWTSGSCTDSVAGKVRKSTAKCYFKLYNGKNEYLYFNQGCFNNIWGSLGDGFWNYMSIRDTVPSYDGRAMQKVLGTNFTKFGEYKIVMEKMDIDICDSDSSWRSETITDNFCSIAVSISEPYLLQKGTNISTIDNSNFDDYYNIDGTSMLAGSELGKIQVSSFSGSKDLGYITDTFIKKYEKLAVKSSLLSTLSPLYIKKVPNKEIYFYDGDISLQDGAILNKPTTIVVKNGNLNIRGSLSGYGMFIVMSGSIIFGSSNCSEKQIVDGIFITNSFQAEKVINDNINSTTWCDDGRLLVNGILIGSGIENIYKNKRSKLEGLGGAGSKVQVFNNGASLYIDNKSKTWFDLPPGADGLLESLNVDLGK